MIQRVWQLWLTAIITVGVLGNSPVSATTIHKGPLLAHTALNAQIYTESDPYLVREFTVNGTPNISIRPGQGSITLIGTTENIVRVEIFVTRRGLAILQADRLMDDYRVVVAQRNNHITAEIASKRGNAWNSNAATFDIVIHAPQQTNASLVTGSGDIEIRDIQGTVEARNGQGNVTASQGTGNSRIFSAAGSISVINHSGVVFANAVAGDIILREIEGETRLKLVAGNAILDNMQGSVIAHVTSGNIHFNSRSIGELIDIETVLGDIQAHFSGDIGLELNIQGTRVSVGSIRNFTGDIRSSRIAGKLNGGGVPIRIKTTMGEIGLTITQDR